MFLVAQVHGKTLAFPQMVVRMLLVLGGGQCSLMDMLPGAAEGTIALGTEGRRGDTALGRVALWWGSQTS